MDRIFSVDDNSTNNINSCLEQNLGMVVAWSPSIDVTGGAGTSTGAIRHKLGSVPNIIHVEPWQSANWWADEADRRLWTKNTICFHTSAAGRYTVFAGRR